LEATADGGNDGNETRGGGEESETVLIICGGGETEVEEVPGLFVVGKGGGLEGRPEMTGGGRSRPSAAFLES